jgi:hypothetical protein
METPEQPEHDVRFIFQQHFHKEVNAWQKCALDLINHDTNIPEKMKGEYNKPIVYTQGEICGEVDYIYLN